jgi:hypothetical protein
VLKGLLIENLDGDWVGLKGSLKNDGGGLLLVR